MLNKERKLQTMKLFVVEPGTDQKRHLPKQNIDEYRLFKKGQFQKNIASRYRQNIFREYCFTCKWAVKAK